jgi:hypothetical protein
MKKLSNYLLFSVFVISLLTVSNGCKEESPTTPTQNTTPPCETYNTAKVFFQNRSNSGKTYDVVWDGSVYYTIGPGQQSDTMTVAAQIPHSLLFKISGTNNIACTQSNPILEKCSIHWYWCDN